MSPLENEFGPWGPREKTPEEAMAELCILLGMGTERGAYSEAREGETVYKSIETLVGHATYEPRSQALLRPSLAVAILRLIGLRRRAQ